jgi:hypothetical protein
MITVEEYLMGRDKDFPLDMLQARNMADLLSRVNHLLASIKRTAKVSSGYRPSSINKSIGGAKMSTHTLCAGIDLHDHDRSLGKLLQSNPKLLEDHGLWLEHPNYTVNKNGYGWVHLDIKKRKNRIFIP